MKGLLQFLMLAVALAFTTRSAAQVDRVYNFHLGVFAGISGYHGDLVENNLDQIAETHPAGGLYLRFNYGKYLSARANVFYGRLSGDDQNADAIWRRRRNLSFRSPVLEVGITPEFNIHHFVLPSSGYVITPYVFAGFAGFYFNPQARYDGAWVNLQPLGTEGQGLAGNDEKYNRFAFAIPGGLGVKFKLSEFTVITWEFGYRYALTDYIDDVGGYYADRDELAESGQRTLDLADRVKEFNEIEPYHEAGRKRFSSDAVDLYIFSGFSLSVNLTPKKAIR